jgi:prepilin-type N-terminal cleavage/methylation domain-containing protein
MGNRKGFTLLEALVVIVIIVIAANAIYQSCHI